MNDDERARALATRRREGRPWHSPPHRAAVAGRGHLLTAACFEHRPIIGASQRRMDEFAAAMVASCREAGATIDAWCLLPDHYHVVMSGGDALAVVRSLGLLHGRTSRAWNTEDGTPSRQVFFRAFDRVLRTEAHFRSAMNYVHHNAVHHGLVRRWSDWRWGSAAEYLDRVGPAAARETWLAYPVLAFGRGWDDAAPRLAARRPKNGERPG